MAKAYAVFDYQTGTKLTDDLMRFQAHYQLEELKKAFPEKAFYLSEVGEFNLDKLAVTKTNSLFTNF